MDARKLPKFSTGIFLKSQCVGLRNQEFYALLAGCFLKIIYLKCNGMFSVGFKRLELFSKPCVTKLVGTYLRTISRALD
jgi:hypothetical protein